MIDNNVVDVPTMSMLVANLHTCYKMDFFVDHEIWKLRESKKLFSVYGGSIVRI